MMRTVCFSVLVALAPLSAACAKPAIDVTRILPPPPADGSAAQKAELAEVEATVAARTPAALAEATADDRLENPMIYRSVVGTGFDLEKLPLTAKLFADVMGAQRAAANDAKDFFHRNRPWVADPALATCGLRGGSHTSYPSGHATMGYATGVVLAALIPEKAQAILARANAYAENRIVCGMHFRRDIVAGQVLGTAVAVTLLDDTELKAEFDAAEQELKAAHLVQ
ncbi:MAG TPA: phosphatase PAP2 family protein [Rhizomicrobium sp.]|nr:phosphatase PAP2 family protein [Rhizomicrobium sp.]